MGMVMVMIRRIAAMGAAVDVCMRQCYPEARLSTGQWIVLAA